MTTPRLQTAFDAEDRRFAALVSGEFSALEDLLADDLRYTHTNGLLEGKADFIRLLRDGTRKYLKVEVIERAGAEKDGFVATFGKLAITLQRPEGPVDIDHAYTGIYVGEDARLFAWAGTKL